MREIARSTETLRIAFESFFGRLASEFNIACLRSKRSVHQHLKERIQW